MSLDPAGNFAHTFLFFNEHKFYGKTARFMVKFEFLLLLAFLFSNVVLHLQLLSFTISFAFCLLELWRCLFFLDFHQLIPGDSVDDFRRRLDQVGAKP